MKEKSDITLQLVVNRPFS